MFDSWVQPLLALPLLAGGLGVFVNALRNPGSVTLLQLSLFAFALQFCLGPVKAALGPRELAPFPASHVAYAFAGIYAFWIPVFLLGLAWKSSLEEREFMYQGRPARLKGIFAHLTEASLGVNMRATAVLYGVVLLVRAVVMGYYGYGVSGTRTLEAVLQLPYVVLVMWVIFSGLGAASVFLCAVKLAYRAPGRTTAIVIILLEAAYTFTQGRRWLFVFLLLLLFGFVFKRGRVNLKHAALGAAGGMLLWTFVFPFFYYMRLQWQAEPSNSVMAWAEGAWRETFASSESAGQQEYQRRVNQRLGALTLNYAVAGSLLNGSSVAQGRFVVNAVVSLVPRAVFPAKLAYAGEPDLELCQMYAVAVKPKDLVSNLPLYGMADAGLLGCAVYGILFLVTIRFAEILLWVLFRVNPLGGILAFGVIATHVVLQMEIHLQGLLSAVRLFVVVFVMMYALGALLGGRVHAPAIDASTYEPVSVKP